MVFFTEWIGDLETQYELGWSMLVIISFNIAANLCVIAYFGSKHIHLLSKRYFKRLKLKLGLYKPKRKLAAR